MRRLRQLSMAVLLTLMVSASAFAGIIDGPPAPTPPPESPLATATGTIETPPSAEAVTQATDPAVDVALNLLQSVLSLF
jgi:hypothetical protein